MPSGLQPVEQSFSSDWSQYIQGFQQGIRANQEMVRSVAEVKRAIGEIQPMMAELSRVIGGLPSTKTITVTTKYVTEGTPPELKDQVQVVRQQVQADPAGIREAVASGQQLIRSAGDIGGGYDNVRSSIRDMAADAVRANTQVADSFTRQAGVTDLAAESIGRSREQVRGYASDVADLKAKSAETAAVIKDMASSAAGPSGGSGTLSDWWKTVRPGTGPTFYAPGVWPPRGATPSDYLPSPGGAGGGGGGGGGRIPLGGADFPPRSAGAQAEAIVGFVKKWWTPVHWAMMATNEVLATVGPALAAAGAATLVGWQGVEQMVPRIKAINATSESLGPAYGITSGQYLGTGNAIQRYQNQATGGVYELGGAGINLMKMGAGTFGQMGLSTIAMLDRGMANMQIGMKQRGTMGTLAGMLGGGTDYLRTFGDIGGNIGNIFLGLAPHLPGVGGDYLSILKGITGLAGGGIGAMNRMGLGNMLGLGLAGEAGMRVGTPMVGLLGKGLQTLGLRGAGLFGGLAESGLGGAGALSEASLGLGGVGEALMGLSGPEVALLAMSAFAGGKLVSSMPTGAMRRVSGLQAGIGQAGFSAAFHPLAKAIVTTTGLAATGRGGSLLSQERQVETPYEIGRFGPGITPTYADTYKAASLGFTQTMGDLVNAGPQLVGALKKAGLKGVGMADAFQIAQNALLDLPHAFGKDGKLNQTALTMLAGYGAAIKPMTQSAGGFNAAIAAQQVMGSPAMKSLSQVNQAMDSMTQVMSGGPAGMATLFGMLGGTPTTVSHGGMKLQAPPAVSAMAKALTSFTSASGASAWNTFAGSQGLVAAEQQNLDQLRTYMTLGALPLQGKTGAQGVAGFQLQQLLPMAQKSPAALAMVMQQEAQMGIGGYYTGDPNKPGVQAANFEAAKKSLASMAGSSQQVNRAMNAAVVASSNLPKTASQFTQGISANLQARQIAQASQDLMKIKQAAGHGGIAGGAMGDLVGQFRAAGIQGGAALKNSVDAALRQAGVSKTMRLKIEGQYFPPHIPKPPDQRFGINGHVNMPPIPKVPDQSFTITGHVVMVGGQVSPYTPAGARANLGSAAYFHPAAAGINPSAYTHLQTGGMVPGSGHGDIIPAMLEPGEAIIPRYLVPLIAPILAAHRVPGFGGMPQSSSSHFAAGGVVPHVLGFQDPASLQGSAGKFAFTLIDGITKALNSAGAKKIADALVSQVSKELSYAKGAGQAAMYGQGYDPSGKGTGIFGGMDVTPGTGGGTVFEQMQSYLGSVKSFTGDIAALRKGHLNKAIISQLVAAGPVQGDALAQSIMHDYGGIRGVNKLWSQLGVATKGLGGQAAAAQFGGLSPNLHSATVNQNHVSITVNAKGGGGLNLTPADIKTLVAQVQAALLKQAKRNPRTGLQLQGKGA